MQNKGFDYYAFISYNHKDAKWAKQLQRQLEHYRLPSALYKEQPELPKRITPVFLDSSDLVARSSLLESLRAKLDASNYLIVLCSPNSAASPWVNDEVEYFISTGRKDRIIPLIIDGEPHAANPARECYPPALASLSSHEELLGIDVQAYGRRGAFLRIIATLLDLRLDRVIARDTAVRRRRFALYACALLLLAATAVSLFWYNTPHTAYYMNYTYVWEKPVGIQPLSSGQWRQLDYMYRFTALRGDVVRVERVNSAGVLASGVSLAWEDPPSMRFYYGTSDGFDGRVVTRVAYYDLYGHELYEKHYSADLSAVDFVQSGNSGASFSLGTDMLSSQAAVGAGGTIEDRSDVIRYIQTYDDNGYLIRRMFKRDNRGSSGGTPTRDENGVWGIEYLRDDLGRVVGMRYLDQDGFFMANKVGVAGCDVTYGESGRVSGWSYLDLLGEPTTNEDSVARMSLIYDELGRMIMVVNRDADDRLTCGDDGVSVFFYAYNDEGFLILVVTLDWALEPCYDRTGIYRTTAIVDDKGRPCRTDFYDTDGELHPCANGYASVIYTYNSDGLATQNRFLGVDGAPAPDLSLNVYGIDYTYTDGLLTRTDYFDDQGCPMMSKEGCASICREYNSERQLSREWYLNVDGEPVRIIKGYAEIRYSYTDGNCTRTDFYDETGVLCYDRYGVSSYVNTYDAGQLTGQSCFGPEGEPVLNDGGWNSISKSFDEGGLLQRECYYGTQGERVIGDDGFSAVNYTYDKAGREIKEIYYDTEDQENPLVRRDDSYSATQMQCEYDQHGNLTRLLFNDGRADASNPEIIREVTYTYDNHRNMTSECWRDDQGRLVPGLNGYATTEIVYDVFNQIAEVQVRNEADALIGGIGYTYDEQGRDIRLTYFDADYYIRRIVDRTFDEYGNCVQEAYLDGQGQLRKISDGYALIRFGYDVFGNMTDRWIYDEAGNPCGDEFHEAYTYSVTGLTLTEAYYDTEEQLIRRTALTYDTCGRQVGIQFYEADGSCSGSVVYTYNSRGELVESTYYNGDGSLKDIECSRFCISEVLEESLAAEAGLQSGDIIIACNRWSIQSMLVDTDESRAQFIEEFQNVPELDKHIVVGRPSTEPMMSFLEVTFPAGQVTGFQAIEDTIYFSEVKEIVNSYNQWLELSVY